jgi:small subunit ribosomal protein S2
MTPADVAKIDGSAKLGGRIDREGWVAQARGMLENV